MKCFIAVFTVLCTDVNATHTSHTVTVGLQHRDSVGQNCP